MTGCSGAAKAYFESLSFRHLLFENIDNVLSLKMGSVDICTIENKSSPLSLERKSNNTFLSYAVFCEKWQNLCNFIYHIVQS